MGWRRKPLPRSKAWLKHMAQRQALRRIKYWMTRWA
jgi:hypothetical protein